MSLLTIKYPYELPDEDADAIADLLETAGIDAVVEPRPVRRGGIQLDTWDVIALAGASTFAKAALEEAGKKVPEVLGRVVDRVRRRRGSKAGDAGLFVELADRRMTFRFPAEAIGDRRLWRALVAIVDTGDDGAYTWDGDQWIAG